MTTTTHAPPDDLSTTMGFLRIVDLDPAGRAEIEYQAGMHMCHSGGVVQGGFVTGWIDAAMAHAVMSLHGREFAPMSLEVKISFFAPVRPGIVIAEGWIERAGKSTSFAEGLLRDAQGNVLAKASSTLRLIPLAKVEAGSRAAIGQS